MSGCPLVASVQQCTGSRILELACSGGRVSKDNEHFNCIVSTNLHEHLGMRNLAACRVLKPRRDEQMASRASIINGLLERLRAKGDHLLLRQLKVVSRT